MGTQVDLDELIRLMRDDLADTRARRAAVMCVECESLGANRCSEHCAAPAPVAPADAEREDE